MVVGVAESVIVPVPVLVGVAVSVPMPVRVPMPVPVLRQMSVPQPPRRTQKAETDGGDEQSAGGAEPVQDRFAGQ
jgi:hypothetical protein